MRMVEGLVEEATIKLAESCKKQIERAIHSGREDGFEDGLERAYDDVALDADAVRAEFSEVVDSFKRGDMPDVRSRLMDFGQLLGLDVWIPSR